MAAKGPDDNTVAITKLLVARREFWYAVLAGIGAVVIVILATLWVYPELLSEIVDLWDEDRAIEERFEDFAPACVVIMEERGCMQAYDEFLHMEEETGE